MASTNTFFRSRNEPVVAAALLAVLAVAALLNACGGDGDSEQAAPQQAALGLCPPATPARLAPAEAVYFGVNLDWSNDSPAAFARRLGRAPAIYVAFAALPFDASASRNLDSVVDAVAAQRAMLMLTIEPHAGLGVVDQASASELARRLAGVNARGVPVFLRFAHEMNGSWYAWSQQPQEYRRAFQTVAAAVHATAPLTAMVWAPNYGGGYPFSGGKYAAERGSAAYSALDTDRDGALTMQDDPYAPYYPGDLAVDWVGMSLYHWGSAYPWGENETPEPAKFAAQLSGEYSGFNGDERAVPDFYSEYAAGHGKPLAITETAAFYAPAATGDDEQRIKETWWQQVFSPENRQRFPRLAMINWFEWSKYETEVSAEVDWTVTRKQQLLQAFQRALPTYLVFSEGLPACP